MRPNPTDAPAGERVYAPASERVAMEPAPGHRDVIFDRRWPHTPAAEPPLDAELPLDAEPMVDAGLQPRVLFVTAALSWLAVAACGVCLWLVVRRRRERNRPINRLRLIAAA